MHLILPNAVKMVWETSIEALDDTLGSANHLEGTPETMIVSGLRATPLQEFPRNQTPLIEDKSHKINPKGWKKKLSFRV